MRARVAIAGDAITVDLTGTSPQTAGPTNVGPAMAPTGAFTIVKSYLDPGSDVNSGAFRPLTVISPARHDRQRQSAGAVRRHGRGEVRGGDGGAGGAGPGARRQGGRRPQGRRQPLLRRRPRSAHRRDVHLLRVPGGWDRRLRRRRRQQHRARVDRERHDHAAADRGDRAALPGARGGDGASRGLRRPRTVARRPRAHARGAHPGAAHAAVGAGRARGAPAVRRVRRRPPAPRIASGSGETDGRSSPRRCRGR